MSEQKETIANPMEQIQNILEDVIGHGATISEILDISHDNLENTYQVAYEFYTSRAYAKALSLFHQLALFDHLDSRFTLGMAACFQQLKDYENAIDFYNISAYCSQLEDPTPFYYAGICQMKMGNVEEALVSLEVATLTGDENSHLEIRKKAKQIHENLLAQWENQEVNALSHTSENDTKGGE